MNRVPFASSLRATGSEASQEERMQQLFRRKAEAEEKLQ
jgi:hypothetical protein